MKGKRITPERKNFNKVGTPRKKGLNSFLFNRQNVNPTCQRIFSTNLLPGELWHEIKVRDLIHNVMHM
jgi:hypothetical protein